jgi:hypothetical protein
VAGARDGGGAAVRGAGAGVGVKFHHLGIPTTVERAGEVYVPHLGFHCTDHERNPFGIQWMCYDPDCAVPPLVREVPHVAFEVDDLEAALVGKTVIIPPNSPSPGVLVAFIEEAGAPVELLQFTGPVS